MIDDFGLFDRRAAVIAAVIAAVARAAVTAVIAAVGRFDLAAGKRRKRRNQRKQNREHFLGFHFHCIFSFWILFR